MELPCAPGACLTGMSVAASRAPREGANFASSAPGASVSSADAAAESSSTLIALAWARYRQQLQKRPLRTKAITSACIAGLSDVIAQRIVGGPYNWRKTLKMALFGFIWSGPSAHYWQDFLQRLFSGRKDGPRTVAEKVVVDQLSYGPLCNVMFMAYTSIVVAGQSPAATAARISRDYPSVQLQGWKLWPLVGIINYRYVPIQYRVLVINMAALLWSTFLILSARPRAAAKTAR